MNNWPRHMIPKHKVDRYFGKCPVRGCKHRQVIDGDPYVGETLIFYAGHNGKALRDLGIWCSVHDSPLKFTQLEARTIVERECNGVCMAAVGPSCDCSCGGENHGKNHVA